MADKLNWKGVATAGAIMWGVYLGLAACFAMWGVTIQLFSPEMFAMLTSIYPGLAPTFAGIITGLLWGAGCGAFCGGIFAGLYNWASVKWK